MTHDEARQLLGVALGAGQAEIDAACRLNAFAWHPDRFPAALQGAACRRFRAVEAAKRRLGEPPEAAVVQRATAAEPSTSAGGAGHQRWPAPADEPHPPEFVAGFRATTAITGIALLGLAICGIRASWIFAPFCGIMVLVASICFALAVAGPAGPKKEMP